MSNIEGKIILVTGASRGIGASAAKTLAAGGAKVIINYAKALCRRKVCLKRLKRWGQCYISKGRC